MPTTSTTSTTSTPSALLDPAALSKIGKLELVARQVMDGYVQGLHRSPHLGFAVDFAQHRQYVAGDDVKRIDWRVYAKADRFYIKQYEVTTTLRATLVVDASGSMGYRGAKDAMSKFRYAQHVAVCLAYLALHQQDAAGLVTFDNKVRDWVPPKSRPSQLLQIVRTLDAARAEKESAIAPLLHEVAERIKRRGLVVVVSDFFDKADDLVEALHHLRHKRHEVILMQVMAEDELTFPFRQWNWYESMERPGERLRLDPSLVRAQYLEKVSAHLKAIRDACNRLAVRHVLLDTSKPFDDALTTYLAATMGRRS